MAPVADDGGVEVAIAVNFRATDEAEVDSASGQRAHDVESAGSPKRSIDIGRVTHGVEEFWGWHVAHHASFKKTDTMGRVCAFGKGEGNQGEPHADKDIFVVVNLARRADDHQFPGGVIHRLYPFYYLI